MSTFLQIECTQCTFHFCVNSAKFQFALTETQQTQHINMLPKSSINSIKANLNKAVSAKDPHGIASAVDLPPLPKSGSDGSSSKSSHRENLKIDGVDWSNVLNPLLDAHSAIQSVS